MNCVYPSQGNQAGEAFRYLFYSKYLTNVSKRVNACIKSGKGLKKGGRGKDNTWTAEESIFSGDYDLIVRARDQTKKVSFSFTRDGPQPSFNITVIPDDESASISIDDVA